MPLDPDENRLAELEAKWLDGTITPEEAAEYADWYNKDHDAPVLIPASFAASEEEHRKRILAKIHSGHGKIVSPFPRLLRIAAVAATVLILLGVAYWYFNRSFHQAPPVADLPNYKNDVPPGNTKGVLTLSNGQRVVLNASSNGLVARQGAINIVNKDSVLTYNAAKAGNVLAYNTLSTNKGEQYPIVLSDGTKVWLNAASSLRFPVQFIGKERKVTITGEAYFEVAQQASKPFIVSVNGLAVKVLGTHFNINAYDDEPDIKTTLLEGVVSVSDGKENIVLQPGEQAIVSLSTSSGIKVKAADVNEAVAWKDGKFSFHHTSIYEIMRQLSRWYDVNVNYQDSLNIYLSGNIRKDVNASKVFRMLELVGEVRFKMEGRTITVMK